MLTIEDLRDIRNRSGFKHVQSDVNSKKPFQAVYYSKDNGGDNKAGRSWFGPRRAAAEEAAQDYCDHINGLGVKAVRKPYRTPTVDMGNTVEHAPPLPAVRIERIVHKGPHDLYDVLIYDEETRKVFRRKVGITARGQKRYADIARTFGFSIAPYNKAITYTTKRKAEKAETALIDEIDKTESHKWRRVGKECFAPVHEVYVA